MISSSINNKSHQTTPHATPLKGQGQSKQLAFSKILTFALQKITKKKQNN